MAKRADLISESGIFDRPSLGSPHNAPISDADYEVDEEVRRLGVKRLKKIADEIAAAAESTGP